MAEPPASLCTKPAATCPAFDCHDSRVITRQDAYLDLGSCRANALVRRVRQPPGDHQPAEAKSSQKQRRGLGNTYRLFGRAVRGGPCHAAAGSIRRGVARVGVNLALRILVALEVRTIGLVGIVVAIPSVVISSTSVAVVPSG